MAENEFAFGKPVESREQTLEVVAKKESAQLARLRVRIPLGAGHFFSCLSFFVGLH